MLIFFLSLAIGILSLILIVRATFIFIEAVARENKKAHEKLSDLTQKNTKLQNENKVLQLKINQLKEILPQKDSTQVD